MWLVRQCPMQRLMHAAGMGEEEAPILITQLEQSTVQTNRHFSPLCAYVGNHPPTTTHVHVHTHTHTHTLRQQAHGPL